MTQTGIYIITNKKNGMQYVGQSRDIKKRLHTHFTGEPNQLIDEVIKKEGKENFDTTITEYPGASKKALNVIERWYIAKLRTQTPLGYNIYAGGTGTLSIRELKQETKRLNQLSEKSELELKQFIKEIESEIAKLPDYQQKILNTLLKNFNELKSISKRLETIIQNYESSSNSRPACP